MAIKSQKRKIKSRVSKWKVKLKNQKSIYEVKSRFKKSIFNLKSRNQMSISEARKSRFEFSLLTSDFRLWPPPPPPSPQLFLNGAGDWNSFRVRSWTRKRRQAVRTCFRYCNEFVSTNVWICLFCVLFLVQKLVDQLVQLNKRPCIILKYLERDLGIRWRFVLLIGLFGTVAYKFNSVVTRQKLCSKLLAFCIINLSFPHFHRSK